MSWLHDFLSWKMISTVEQVMTLNRSHGVTLNKHSQTQNCNHHPRLFYSKKWCERILSSSDFTPFTFLFTLQLQTQTLFHRQKCWGSQSESDAVKVSLNNGMALSTIVFDQNCFSWCLSEQCVVKVHPFLEDWWTWGFSRTTWRQDLNKVKKKTVTELWVHLWFPSQFLTGLPFMPKKLHTCSWKRQWMMQEWNQSSGLFQGILKSL